MLYNFSGCFLIFYYKWKQTIIEDDFLRPSKIKISPSIEINDGNEYPSDGN